MSTNDAIRIAILDGETLNPGDLSWDHFRTLGPVDLYPATPRDQTIARSHTADVLIVNKVIIDQHVIDQCPGLQYIGITATGFNNVDIAYAAARNITVCNVPVYGTRSVVQMVFAHILNHACQFTPHVNSVHAVDWQRSENFCYTLSGLSELVGKVIGIVGLGRTGTQVVQVAQAFGMKAIAYHYKPISSDIELVDLETLFAQADYISLHTPLTPTTQAMVDRRLIALMQPHAFLVNTARGGLIVEKDLAEALNHEQIAGAGLDVLSTEPPHPDNPLLNAQHCFITPHIAWITQEARQRLIQQSYENLTSWLAGTPVNVVSC